MWDYISKTYAKNDVPHLKRSICEHIEKTLASTRYDFDIVDAYHAAAFTLRDRLIEYWNDTQSFFTEQRAKRAYYLSIEFLMGRFLSNAVTNLDLSARFKRALCELGLNYEAIVEQEKDAALGNGGLGRLAACFLDSLATLNYPAWGYGLRYKYGIFRQALEEGFQTECPDYWLASGAPWEIERSDVRIPVRFGGHVETTTNSAGHVIYRWIGGIEIIAKAYDVPVPGFNTFNTINLRLWSSEPSSEFDFKQFNRGDYMDAVRSKQEAENLTAVLYPNDNIYQGQELRLKQQYFFVCATLHDILRRVKKRGSVERFHEQAAIQLNDTHPALAVPELMRILLDEENLAWDAAWATTQATFSFTNHTVLPEALETWPVPLVERLLPRHMQLIYEINHRWLTSLGPDDPAAAALSIIEEGHPKRVRMAHLAVVASHAVNGVAALHSDLLRTHVFREFHARMPEKFRNVTNGVTQRRWIGQANPALAGLLTAALGSDAWMTDMRRLRSLNAEDPVLRARWRAAKLACKERLAVHIQAAVGLRVDTRALFDVHAKRIHEYKRQLLNILRVIRWYLVLKAMSPEERARAVPRVSIFAGKAAPGYLMAKRIIKLINSVGEVVNHDASIDGSLRVVFIPDYSVTWAERIVPASDISEHVSTAGTEASGTSNMKFAMNGGLLLGTMDGATIEIREEVGPDQVFVFGLHADEVDAARREQQAGRHPLCPELAGALEAIESGMFGDPEVFRPIAEHVRGEDRYLIARDFASYDDAHHRIDALWRDPDEWTRRTILCTSRMAKFSSDRSIRDYAAIWGIEPHPLPDPVDKDALNEL